MMRLRRSIACALSAGAALCAGLGGSETAAGQTLAAAPSEDQSGARSADALLPLADVLAAVGLQYGLSFVFDSRLVEHKAVAAPPHGPDVAAALAEILKSFALTLNKVGATTYVIRPSEAAAAIDFAPAAIAPAETDFIVVTSTLDGGGARIGAATLYGGPEIDLDYVGVGDAADAIYDLPQSLASVSRSNTALLGLTAGLSLADFRGLGPQRTAVFVNGRQRTESPGGNGDVVGFDLGAAPTPFLDRIEIESRPAGARLSAKAATGAVNFVLKRELTTVKAGAASSVSARGDAVEKSLYVVGGRDLAAGAANITAGLLAVDSAGLLGARRPVTAAPYGYALDGKRSSKPGATLLPGFGGSLLTQRGYISSVVRGGVPERTSPNAARIVGADGMLTPFDGTLDQLFNYTADQSVVLPVEKLVGYGSATWRIAPSVRLFGEWLGAASRFDGGLAPLPATSTLGVDPAFGDAVSLPIGHPTISAPLRDQIRAVYGSNVDAIVLDRRFVEIGPRRQRIVRHFADLRAGAEWGDVETRGAMFSYRYGRAATRSTDFDRVDSAKLDVALDAPLCAATAGCAPADFFAPSGLSPATLRFISAAPLVKRISIVEHEAELVGRYGIDETDWTGALSAGLDVKSSRLLGKSDVKAGVEPIGDLALPNHRGRLRTTDLFWGGEAHVDRRAHSWGAVDLSTFVRMTASPAYGAAWNVESAASWSPAPEFSLQATRHVGASF